MSELSRPYEFTQEARGAMRHERDSARPGEALRGLSRNISVYEPEWADGPICTTDNIIREYTQKEDDRG